MTVSMLSATSTGRIMYTGSSKAAGGNPLPGLGSALVLVLVVWMIWSVVGRILAHLSATTRREFSVLDCTAWGANVADDRALFDDLILENVFLEDPEDAQQRRFEWVDVQAEGTFDEVVRG